MTKVNIDTLEVLSKLVENGKRLEEEKRKQEKFFKKLDRQFKKIINKYI